MNGHQTARTRSRTPSWSTCAKHKVPVTIFLANGIRLQGYVTGFDSYSVLLGRDRQAQLIYKHAISTILPGEPVRIGQSDEPAAAKV